MCCFCGFLFLFRVWVPVQPLVVSSDGEAEEEDAGEAQNVLIFLWRIKAHNLEIKCLVNLCKKKFLSYVPPLSRRSQKFPFQHDRQPRICFFLKNVILERGNQFLKQKTFAYLTSPELWTQDPILRNSQSNSSQIDLLSLVVPFNPKCLSR